MDNSSLIKSPISEELEDFKKLFESTLSSSNLLLNSVIAHIRQKNGKMMRPILVLLAAMPAASNGTVLCLAYDGDTRTMSRGTFLTTVFSLITLPVIALIVV